MLSKVINLPDFSQLRIPEAQRVIRVKDETIFRDLRNEKRRITDQTEGAKVGDYVLVELCGSDGRRTSLHLELGKKQYLQLCECLIGCHRGDKLVMDLHGVQTTVQVSSVRTCVEFPLTDASIKSLKLPNISSLEEYRKMYIRKEGEGMIDRIFQVIYKKLRQEILSLTTFYIDEGEERYYHEQQRQMIQNLTGNVNQRLLDAFGEDGKKTLEECDRLFFEENRIVFANYLLGKALAEKNQIVPTEEEVELAVENYSMVFEKTKEQIDEEGLMEDVLRSFYLQYGTMQMKEYYKSIITFVFEGH